MGFDCDVHAITPSQVLVELKGTLDADACPRLEMAAAEYLANPEVKTVIWEASRLVFMTSAGLRVLMLHIKSVPPRNGHVYLVQASHQVYNLIKMTGMSKWVRFRDTVSECTDD